MSEDSENKSERKADGETTGGRGATRKHSARTGIHRADGAAPPDKGGTSFFAKRAPSGGRPTEKRENAAAGSGRDAAKSETTHHSFASAPAFKASSGSQDETVPMHLILSNGPVGDISKEREAIAASGDPGRDEPPAALSSRGSADPGGGTTPPPAAPLPTPLPTPPQSVPQFETPQPQATPPSPVPQAEAPAAPAEGQSGEGQDPDKVNLELIDLSLEDVGLDDIWIEDDTGNVSRDFKEVAFALKAIKEARKNRFKGIPPEMAGYEDEDGDFPDDPKPRKRRYFLLRLMAGLAAVVITVAGMILAYIYAYPYLFPIPEPVYENRRQVQVAGNQVHFLAGTEVLAVSLPDDYQVLDPHQFFRQFPLSEKAARYEKCEVVFAGKATVEGKTYFISLALDDEAKDTWYSDRQFRAILNKTVNARKIAGAVEVGEHRVIEPFEVTPRSGCYGRVMNESATFGSTRLSQYSCMLYYGNRVLILNSGYTGSGRSSHDKEFEHCRQVLLQWRDLLLGKSENEPEDRVVTPLKLEFISPPRPIQGAPRRTP